MNKAIIYISLSLGLLNLLTGLIVSFFEPFNVVVSTLVIAITSLLLLAVYNKLRFKDAFKASLTLILSIAGLLQYLLAVFMPSYAKDNWCLVIILVIYAFEAILLFSANSVSKTMS